MADVIEIKAASRARTGKGAARAVRREGRVPGVVYGERKGPETVALDHNELFKLVNRGKFLSTVFELNVDGAKSRVLPREVQLDPVKDFPIHVDFQRIGAASRIRVNVPVRFVNELLSPGLKRGGVLNVVRHTIEVTCPPDKIPEHIEVNLEGLEIGRSVHISAIKLPEGVKPTILDRDFTVATVAGRKAEEEVKPAEAVPVEGAVAPEAGAEGTPVAAPGAKGAEPVKAEPAAKGAAPDKGKEKGKEKGKK